MPLGKFAIGGVDDADFVVRQRETAGDKAQRAVIRSRWRQRLAVEQKRIARDDVDLRSAPERRETDPERTFGETIYREHRVAAETVAAKALAELFHRVRTYGFSAIERNPPAA